LGLGTTDVNPFRTFERKEVGIKLEVLPQISWGCYSRDFAIAAFMVCASLYA